MSLFINLAAIDLKSYFRNSMALFFTFLFPVLLLILLMLAFGGERAVSKISIQLSGDSARAGKYMQDMGYILDNSPRKLFTIQKLTSQTPPSKSAVWVDVPSDLSKKISITIGEDLSYGTSTSIYALMLVNAMGEIGYEKWDYLLNIVKANENSNQTGFKYGQYLIPGLIGMILISTSLFGFCVFLVEQRAKGAFKAYHLYPMEKWKFLAAFAVTRFLILVAFSFLFLVVADWVYDQGAIYSLALVGKLLLLISLGAIAFLSIALLISARIMAVGMVTGIANLVFYPFTFASDLYIPQEGFPEFIKTIANLFPLGPFSQAMRDITYHGANLGDIGYALGLLSIWAVVCFIATVILFKWTKD